MPAQTVDVASVDEIPEGKVKMVTVDSLHIALCNYAGKIYAIDNVCTHDGGPLDQGELEGNEIECPRHGARFDVTTGQVKALPAVRPVRTYPVRVTDGRIFVDLPS
jgi:3-phenylpropionate/trans-cinnamate dioxygenase ferredoxin component